MVEEEVKEERVKGKRSAGGGRQYYTLGTSIKEKQTERQLYNCINATGYKVKPVMDGRQGGKK